MPTSLSNRPIIALTMGDPAGIGPEIILKALAKPSVTKLANYIIVGDINVFKKTASTLRRKQKPDLERLSVISSFSVAKKLARSNPINIFDLHNVSMASFSFGRTSASFGRASVEYIRKAHGLIRANIADAIVTAPINKSSVKMGGFKFPGHTEYLAYLSGTKRYVMMLIGGPLRISLVTRHIPLNKVSRNLTTKDIADTIEITLDALKTDFDIQKPKIGVCALNPHAGEGGIFGDEEKEIISPAVDKFRRAGTIGPIPADALFYNAYNGKIDSIICLYHDQGLIPLKMIARDEGVNTTLGLRFVRTSPDHGTAFDIAGKGKAYPRSMEMAIKTAISIVDNRKRNVLQKRN